MDISFMLVYAHICINIWIKIDIKLYTADNCLSGKIFSIIIIIIIINDYY